MPRRLKLPISNRDAPDAPAWFHELTYLQSAGAGSLRTEHTYRSGLRLLADWIQHFGYDGFTLEMPWPLSPAGLTTATIMRFRHWLLGHRSRSTVTTYTAAIAGYLNFLDGLDELPAGVQIGKLSRQLARRPVERHASEKVIDMDIARQGVPRIVSYYQSLPLPASNDAYNRRLSLLRDRALVMTLYATAARISEVVALNRVDVDHGRARYASIKGKGSRPRTIFLREYAGRAIAIYLRERTDGNPALFVSHSRNGQYGRLTITSAHNVVKKAVRALGLHESLSAHDFRHYRATQLLREGMPIEVVQEYLGHADISTTRGIYAPVLGVQIVSEWLDNVDVPPASLAVDGQ